MSTDKQYYYGVITKILTKSSKKPSKKDAEQSSKQQIFYTVQYYDTENDNTSSTTAGKPNLCKCHIPHPPPSEASPFSGGKSLRSVALVVDDIVLIEHKSKNSKKAGYIRKVLSRTEKTELLEEHVDLSSSTSSIDHKVPPFILQRLRDEGYDTGSNVSFDDTVYLIMDKESCST